MHYWIQVAIADAKTGENCQDDYLAESAAT